MTKLASIFLSAAVVLVTLFSVNDARAFGDEPYLPGLNDEPAITSGCWKWNWQQYSWYDHCPVYVRPKAYMYRSSYRPVLRTKG
jgi:hypothetical protein